MEPTGACSKVAVRWHPAPCAGRRSRGRSPGHSQGWAQCEFKVKPPEGTNPSLPSRGRLLLFLRGWVQGWWVESESVGLERRLGCPSPEKGAGHKPGAPLGEQGEEGSVQAPRGWGWAVQGCRCPPQTARWESSCKEHTSPTGHGCFWWALLSPAPPPPPRAGRLAPTWFRCSSETHRTFLNTFPWEASPEPPWASGTTPRPALAPVASGPGPSLRG